MWAHGGLRPVCESSETGSVSNENSKDYHLRDEDGPRVTRVSDDSGPFPVV